MNIKCNETIYGICLVIILFSTIHTLDAVFQYRDKVDIIIDCLVEKNVTTVKDLQKCRGLPNDGVY